jgi:hypothetical protein
VLAAAERARCERSRGMNSGSVTHDPFRTGWAFELEASLRSSMSQWMRCLGCTGARRCRADSRWLMVEEIRRALSPRPLRLWQDSFKPEFRPWFTAAWACLDRRASQQGRSHWSADERPMRVSPMSFVACPPTSLRPCGGRSPGLSTEFVHSDSSALARLQVEVRADSW